MSKEFSGLSDIKKIPGNKRADKKDDCRRKKETGVSASSGIHHTILDYNETNKHPVFKDAEKVALCLCTIGPDLEDEINQLMEKNEMVRALILDSLGSEAAEEVAIQSDRRLADMARELRFWPSKRYSPGYGKWDVKEQKYIFQVLPGKDIGVSLTESCMMLPRKSVSFRINFYKNKKLTTRKNNN